MEEAKPKRAKQEGKALEIDVIKKISHQLDRPGLSVDAMGRILAYVSDAVREKKLEFLKSMEPNGQTRIPDPKAGLF